MFFHRDSVGFAVAGGLALIVDLAIFNMLILQKVNLTVANGVAVFAALLVNYIINHWTFLPRIPARNNLVQKSFRFGVVAASSALYLLIGFEIVSWFLPDQSAATYSLVRIFLIGSGTIARFGALRYWVFKKKRV